MHLICAVVASPPLTLWAMRRQATVAEMRSSMLLPSRAALSRSCYDKTCSEEHVGDTVIVALLLQRLEECGALNGNEGLPHCAPSFVEDCHSAFDGNFGLNYRLLHVACKQHATCHLSRNATPMNSDDLGLRTDLCRWIGQTCQSAPRGSQDRWHAHRLQRNGEGSKIAIPYRSGHP